MKNRTLGNSYAPYPPAKSRSRDRHDGFHRPYPRSDRPLLSEEQIHAFYDAHIDGLKANDKGFAWGRCPFHADHSPSFSVNLRTGRYECKSTSCGAAGADLVSFVGRLHGLSYLESLEYVEDNT